MIFFKSDTFNFGRVLLHSPHQFDIKFWNKGTDLLVISNVQSGDPHYGIGPKDPIKPGDSAIIKLYVPTDCPRVFNKSLTITSNSTSRSTYTLRIVGEVLPDTCYAELVLETDTIDFGTVKYDSDGNRVIRFTNKGTCPLIISHGGYGQGFSVTKWPLEPIKPGGKGEIQYHYDTKRVGGFCKHYSIESNARNGRVNYIVKGTVLPQKQ